MTDTPTPPVSPDPWEDVEECIDRMRRGSLPIEAMTAAVDAARAADALRHQQETADLTRAVQGNALAVVKASAEGGSQIADLRAALSTAEATIASLTAQVTALETELDETSSFIARATTGPDSPLNLAVDVEARAVKAEQERDAAQQENQTLREALDKLAREALVVVGFAQSWMPLSVGDIADLRRAGEQARATLASRPQEPHL